MNELQFDLALASGYRSPSQRARILTEDWMRRQGYCPRCGRPSLAKYANNKPVADFYCDGCHADFELKSQSKPFGPKLNDGAYTTTLERINSCNNPHFFLLHHADCTVRDLCVIPNYFFTPSLIEPRKPLADTARRAGWQGCMIRIGEVPAQGRIYLVHDGQVVDKAQVVNQFQRTLSLQTNSMDARGWLLDVLRCVERIPHEGFTLQEVYAFAPFLQQRHPGNHHVEAKIRQQLQHLRDRGFIAFDAPGCYKKLS